MVSNRLQDFLIFYLNIYDTSIELNNVRHIYTTNSNTSIQALILHLATSTFISGYFNDKDIDDL